MLYLKIIILNKATMDLTQRKLNKSEWDSIEIPVSESEKKILKIATLNYCDIMNNPY